MLFQQLGFLLGWFLALSAKRVAVASLFMSAITISLLRTVFPCVVTVEDALLKDLTSAITLTLVSKACFKFSIVQ